MTKLKGQRVGVFVDAQNIYYSARFLYNRKVDFAAILKEAVKGRQLIRAVVYVIKAEMTGEQAWFDRLRHIGFEVKAKDIQIFPGGQKKGDWDVGIAMDTIEMAPKLDAIVLVSGDGDYEPLVHHLKRAMGCLVEVMAFGKSTSSKLIEVVDDYTDMDQRKSLFLRNAEAEKRSDRYERSASEGEDIGGGPPPTTARPRNSVPGKTRPVPSPEGEPQLPRFALPDRRR